jgi:hypothetical protein
MIEKINLGQYKLVSDALKRSGRQIHPLFTSVSDFDSNVIEQQLTRYSAATYESDIRTMDDIRAIASMNETLVDVVSILEIHSRYPDFGYAPFVIKDLHNGTMAIGVLADRGWLLFEGPGVERTGEPVSCYFIRDEYCEE